MDPASISPVLAIALIAFGFGFIIFVHEMGHFLVAKAVGIHCTQFAIGFGQSLLTWRKGLGFRVGTTEREYYKRIAEHLGMEMGPDGEPPESIPTEKLSQAASELGLGETEYRLNWMPLGGYVKMVGQEDMDPTALSGDPRAFNNAPIWARMCVISAGVVMNAIFALIFFIGAFLYGVSFPPAEIGSVSPGSPAATAVALNNPEVVGLKMGDRVVLLNGEEPSDFMDLSIASALSAEGEQITLTVERPSDSNARYEFIVEPKFDPVSELRSIGIGPPVDLKLTHKPGNISDKNKALGIEPGMTLTAVNDQAVDQYWQVLDVMRRTNGSETAFTFADTSGQSLTVHIEPDTGLMGGRDPNAPEVLTDYNLLGLTLLTQVNGIIDGSAAQGVLEEGDIVVGIGEAHYPSIGQMIDVVQGANDKPLPITVLRAGRTEELGITPRGGKLGVELGYAYNTNRIRNVIDNSPFAALNLPDGAVIVAVNGRDVHSFAQIRNAIQDGAGGPIELTTTSPLSEGLTENGKVGVSPDQHKQLADLGWYEPFPFEMRRDLQKASSAAEATVIGFEKTKLYMLQTYITLARLIDGGVKVKHMRGPVGIAHEGTRIAEQGVSYLVFFLGLISVNLAVINFLPLPIVDGGQFLLLVWEKIRGKPVPANVQSAIMVVGLAFLGTLFLYITYQDIWRIFTG